LPAAKAGDRDAQLNLEYMMSGGKKKVKAVEQIQKGMLS
jgi:hypothetical protein